MNETSNPPSQEAKDLKNEGTKNYEHIVCTAARKISLANIRATIKEVETPADPPRATPTTGLTVDWEMTALCHGESDLNKCQNIVKANGVEDVNYLFIRVRGDSKCLQKTTAWV